MGATNIYGTVTGEYVDWWELRYFRVGDWARGWVRFAEGDSATNGFLGTFDPTLLPNGVYTIILVGADPVDGGGVSETRP